ncbi:hypothetical protein [Streptomyces sp. NPDC056663]|uniref:hypothetical protein n=1 Tax=Streptomyces sp. NPDC056663 TaxID=3345899 RepID=UPI003694424A
MTPQIVRRRPRACDAVRASLRSAGVFFAVCRYVRCGEDNRWICSAVAIFNTLSAQYITTQLVRRPRRIRHALARHHPTPFAAQAASAGAATATPAVQRGATTPMISAATDTALPHPIHNPGSENTSKEERRRV